MALKTPPLHARGLYQLAAPWSLTAGKVYECVAIRDFADFVEKGRDPFTLYYNPRGLSQAVYEADKAAGANIITLVCDDEPVIYVPDTYILAYPNMGNVAYNNVVLSINLGAVPDFLDLEFLKDQIVGVVTDVIGVTGEVKEHIAPSTGVVTQEEHDVAEVARQAAIANRTTDRAKLIEAQITIDALRVAVANLEAIVKHQIENP